MKERLVTVLINLLGILLFGFLYAWWCQVSHWHIPCIFHKITGLYCPGCGITRMCLALLNGDLKTAFNSNPAIFTLAPVGLLLGLRITYHYIKTGNMQLSKYQTVILWVIVVILVIFGIVRNILLLTGHRP